MSGAICGGVISMSMLMRDIKKYGAYADMMAYVMPDKQYARFITLKKANKGKEAQKVFDREFGNYIILYR